MGHFCWMCGRVRANEEFSGRGHRQHLCRECARLPLSERERKQRLDQLRAMLVEQRVLSPKNIRTARDWARSEDSEVRELAQLVADIGQVHPSRKRRLSFLQARHPELCARMIAAGVAYVPDGDPEYGFHGDDGVDVPEDYG
jgi:hypothetical protein